MSYDTNKSWLYRLEGRYIYLWQYMDGAATTMLDGHRIQLPDEYYGKQLIYPDEDITNGLRIEYTSLSEPFVDEAWESLSASASGTTISFGDGTTVITGTGLFGDFDTDGGEGIRIIGSASNDGDYTTASADDDSITISGDTFTLESAGESITVYQIPDEDASPSETSHLNLNRMLSLAVVDYLKAMLSEQQGNLEVKEYYMKQFWKKVGDNESNKRKISMTFPSSPYAIR